VLLCRTDRFLGRRIKRKIALFCDVAEKGRHHRKDVDTIYEVPARLKAEGLDQNHPQAAQLPLTQARTEAWEELVDRIKNRGRADRFTSSASTRATKTRTRA
jgi:CTP synthase